MSQELSPGSTTASWSQQPKQVDQLTGPRPPQLPGRSYGKIKPSPMTTALLQSHQKLMSTRGDTVVMWGPFLCGFNYGPHFVLGGRKETSGRILTLFLHNPIRKHYNQDLIYQTHYEYMETHQKICAYNRTMCSVYNPEKHWLMSVMIPSSSPMKPGLKFMMYQENRGY